MGGMGKVEWIHKGNMISTGVWNKCFFRTISPCSFWRQCCCYCSIILDLIVVWLCGSCVPEMLVSFPGRGYRLLHIIFLKNHRNIYNRSRMVVTENPCFRSFWNSLYRRYTWNLRIIKTKIDLTVKKTDREQTNMCRRNNSKACSVFLYIVSWHGFTNLHEKVGR